MVAAKLEGVRCPLNVLLWLFLSVKVTCGGAILLFLSINMWKGLLEFP